MIRLARHIEILLLGNECVIVPNLGGFVVHHRQARYDMTDGLFLPPLRSLGFNSQLRQVNDSLLAQSYVEAYDLSYPEALDAIEEEVREVLRIMGSTGSYEFNSLGKLYYDKDGRMNFEPCESGILTPEFYALSSFEMPLLESKTQTEEANDVDDSKKEHRPRVIFIGKEYGQKTLNISLKAIRNVSVAAVILATVFLVTFPLVKNGGVLKSGNIESGFYEMFFNNQGSKKDQPIAPMKVTNAKAPAQEKKVSQAPVAEEPAVVEPVQEQKQSMSSADEEQPQSSYWSIVVCTHVTKKNAETLTEKLQKQGYSDVHMSTAGATKVLYGKFATKADAHKKLNELTNNELFKDSWLLEVKE